jgi:replication-associated recombination protein RarA
MTFELDHLAPEFREEAQQADLERIQRIRVERWISYPKADFVLTRLAELLVYPPRDRMPSLLLFGATGIGKTKILRKFIREHPSRCDRRTGVTVAPVVTMQMPPEPDEKSFYDELLGALQAPFRQGNTVGALRRSARDLLGLMGARMLIIDEVHSLLAGTYRQQRIMLNTLRFLANDLKIPLICAGTADAKRALMTDQQLADRFEAIELTVWRNDESFCRFLASYQAILPLRKPSDLTSYPVRQALLEYSGGITVRLVRLIESLAITAIRSGHEKIDAETLVSPSLPTPLLSMADLAGTDRANE